MRDRDSGFFDKVAYTNDAELVAGLLVDAPIAWKAFEIRHGRLVERCIAKVLRRSETKLSDEDIAEVKSSMIVHLLANDRSKLRSWSAERGASFSSWVCMVAIQTAHDYARVAGREPRKEDEAAALEVESQTPDPYQLTAILQSVLRTRQVIGTLSAKDQEFALLYFTEGLPPEEVAKRMRISINTVYSKRHKIKARLIVALTSKRNAA